MIRKNNTYTDRLPNRILFLFLILDVKYDNDGKILISKKKSSTPLYNWLWMPHLKTKNALAEIKAFITYSIFVSNWVLSII